MFVNITTESGELLERFEVTVTDDKLYPVGRGLERAAILLDIEMAARIVQARRRTRELVEHVQRRSGGKS